MINFTKKGLIVDPLKKLKIDEAIIKMMLVNNLPLETVEKYNFRELLYVLEPDYICSSRPTFRQRIAAFGKKIQAEFKKELKTDFSQVPDKVICLTSDHGTSHDRFRTHKNALTVTRCTKKFVIKTDTAAVIKCDGSQTGELIRTDVRDKLDELGRTHEWIINWTTDGESKQVNARARGKHQAVGMETNYTGNKVLDYVSI